MRPWQVLPTGEVVAPDGSIPVLAPASAGKLFAIRDYLQPLIAQHAARTGVPFSWILGVIWAETGFLGPDGGHSAAAVSPKGAVGRMQLMPFWFDHPHTGIGDGWVHSPEEMTTNDALNLWFGTDLLKKIQDDGNSLPEIASIYNCGSIAPAHPWVARPSDASPWGLCAEGDYIRHVVAASNTVLRAKGPLPGAPGGVAARAVAALTLGAVAVWAAGRFRGRL